MCEEQPAVRALGFLQTEVSFVVDHGSTDEATLFRSLLTHLLNPTARSRPITPGSSMRRQGHGQNHQNQEGSRKRSRSEDDWTNRLSGESDEDVDMNNAATEGSNGVTTLTIEEDPLERGLRSPLAPTSTPIPEPSPISHDPYSASGLATSVATPTPTDQAPAPSPIRFKQRVEVFEALLEFINENAKQPSGDLLDCISLMGEF